MKPQKQYTGSVYIGVVGPEADNGECRDSIQGMIRRNGDGAPVPLRATKGYEARQLHIDRWLTETRHEFALLLDHDMVFQPDTLERLRSHQLPYVSGYYLRRRFAPIAPVWFKPWSGAWPFEPWSSDPERNKLHPLGASGWGCILIHREVVLAVRKLLKGEWEVLEDDMDVWPYDLGAVMQAVRGLRTLTTERPSLSTLRPALAAHVEVLERELRPLRGSKDTVGSDIRFPFYARAAGYPLMGDPDVRPAHMLNYPLSPDDYSLDEMGDMRGEYAARIETEIKKARRAMRRTLQAVKGA